MRIGLVVSALVSATALLSPVARADVQHTVARGHTVEAIANRYRVSAKSIIVANKLKDVRRLKVGDVLTIPNVDAPKKKGQSDNTKKGHAKGKSGKDGKSTARPIYTAKPKTPGVVHIRRVGTSEAIDVRITDKSGRVSTSTLKTFEKMMRSASGTSHPVEARLISLLGLVSNHFGSRKIEVISGFRPYAPAQYTAHSNHNHGKAIDFRVVGVPNEVVRDFCRTLRNVGCGYYPNGRFVHMDVRERPAFWIDYAKPGEPPRYSAGNVDPDEGLSDVQGDGHPSANTAPIDEPVPGTKGEGEGGSGTSTPLTQDTREDP